MIKKILLFLFLFTGFQANAVIMNIDDNGILMGIDDVDVYGTLYNVIGDKGVHSNLATLRSYVDEIAVFDAALLSIERVDHHCGHGFLLGQGRNSVMQCR